MDEITLASNKKVMELDKKLLQIKKKFVDYKYTVYRACSKIVEMQKELHTHKISWKLIQAIITRHCANDKINAMVLPYQLIQLIQDIYIVSERLGHLSGDIKCDQATLLLSNFFWNVFDPIRRHSISLLEIKATFLLICKLSRNDEVSVEFYKLLHDPVSKCVPQLNFEYLVNIFAKILSYLGESKAYGEENVLKVIEQSYKKCHNSKGLSEKQFLDLWFSNKTRFLIYANLIITTKRIESTEKLVHNNPCAACGIEKIIGIRFKCRSCKNLSLCMRCFASNYATGKHQAGHRVYEMFNEDAPPKKITHYFAKLCNAFFTDKGTEEEIKEFCNTNENNRPNETELVAIRTVGQPTTEMTSSNSAEYYIENSTSDLLRKNQSKNQSSLAELSTTAVNATQASARLQSIIDKVLVQNFKIEQYLKFVPSASPEQLSEFLQSHQKFLKDIIKEMRNFKCNSSSFPTIHSTPNHSGALNKTLILDCSNLTTQSKNLTHSINGADINRSYLEANKSDYSLNDISLWFNQRRSLKKPNLNAVAEIKNDNLNSITNSLCAVDLRETEMTNFRLLLNKVKEIVEDSYSDNTELAAATQNLENVLDSIIQCEVSRRLSSEST